MNSQRGQYRNNYSDTLRPCLLRRKNVEEPAGCPSQHCQQSDSQLRCPAHFPTAQTGTGKESRGQTLDHNFF